MKIKIWIRPGADGKPTMRLDYEYESRDTPLTQNFGNRLMKALEGCGGDKPKESGVAK